MSVQHVSQLYYLVIPVLTGAFLVLVLVTLTMLIGVPCLDARTGTAHAGGKFWISRFYASGAWTFNDSWATNIGTLGTTIGVLLAAGGTLQSIFSTLDLNPFVIMNVACGGVIASAPLLFGIVNVMCSHRFPMALADASVRVGKDITMLVPAGASIAVPGGATIGTGKEKVLVKAGGTIPAPPGSTVTIKSGATMSLPSGAALAVDPGSTLSINVNTWVAANDLAPAQDPPAQGLRCITGRRRHATPPSAVDTPVNADAPITVTGGATATIVGVADMTLWKDTTITAPSQRGMTLKADRPIVVPPGSNVLVADMRSLLSAAAVTTFGIGTEIGLIAVLAIHFSGATSSGRVASWVISAIVGAGLVLYGATGIRALADPTSGSSLSAGSGTSFTL